MLWYQNDLTTLAFLWRLERVDGVALGFTSHDRDLVHDGLTYRSTPGMLPSAIERSDGLEYRVGDALIILAVLLEAPAEGGLELQSLRLAGLDQLLGVAMGAQVLVE